MNFPDQTIRQKDKNQDWCSEHLDYANAVYRGNSSLRSKMDSDFNSFNGIKEAESIKYLIKTYGKKNTPEYISYRSHIPKIQLRVGEFLSQPLASTVETINRDAKSEKMKRVDYYMGAMVAKQELTHIKDKVGVDVMEGADIPDSEEDPLWTKMSTKDKEESVMQIILNEQIPSLDLKHKLSEGVLNGQITSVMFGKVERNEQGDTDFINIDPREAIFEEIKGDTFLEKSPILGSAIWMSVNDILKRYRLTVTQIKLLKEMSSNYQKYNNNNSIRSQNGGIQALVIHIEWKSVLPKYFKRIKKTDNQLAIDSEETHIVHELDTEKYENGKDWHDGQVEKGKYEVEVKYMEDLWEGTRIAGMRELDVNCRRAYFHMRRVDDPARIIGGSYCGFLCQTIDGVRISLMNQMENLSNIFDITMYKILSDVIRSKGKVLGFNMATLHKDSSVEKTMRELVNDGFLKYDTSATGNVHGRDVSLNNMLQEFDMGLSNSFGALMKFKDDILDMMDRMTGINRSREGNISASATVSNTNTEIQASSNITAAFDYGVHLYIEKVLTKIVESTKVTWAFYKLDKGEQILGSNKFNFLKVSQSIGFKDYGVHLQDGSKYAKVRQFMTSLMESSLNAKEIRPEDALKFMLSETFADQKAVLEDSWAKIKELEGQSQQAQMQNQQQMQQQQLQQQIQLAREDREDRQANEKENIILEADQQIRIDDNKGTNKVIEQDHKFSNENVSNDNY